MRRTVYLAWRYLAYHRLKTAILVVSLTVMFALPLTVQRLVDNLESGLTARAKATPLIVGRRGSRFDLTLHALYFNDRVPGTVSMQVAQAVRDSGLAGAIPLYLRFTARGYPIAGTSLDYFDFRGLRISNGSGLVRLGDCVLGADVARELQLTAGDRLMSDPENVFDIAGSYPVNMRVTGVLAPSGSADDGAVFVDVKTAWLIAGLAHGHMDVAKAGDSDVVLSRTASNVTANAALPQYMEVTEANMGSFHFHGDPGLFPITAVLAVPHDGKSQTILRGRYLAHEEVQVIVPTEVVDELIGVVFRIKRFLDANLAVVGGATLLLLVLVVLLSLRLRQREMEIMFMLGCSRGMIVRLQVVELGFVAVFSGMFALAIAEIAARWAPGLLGIG